MRSSSIYIKFSSEAEFERLTFPSQVVSYDEIKKHLEKKKKIVFQDKKTDKIVLIDINKNKEISDGFIEANTRVIVFRTPIPQLNMDPIELTYNPKQTAFDRSLKQGGDKSQENGPELNKDDILEKGKSDVPELEGQTGQDEERKDTALENTIKFKTSKIDLSVLGPEFMCAMPNSGETNLHIIIDPVIFSCCGTTCCLECVHKIFTTRSECPFCNKNFQQSGVKIFPNLPIQRLFNQELIKVEKKLSYAEKERLQRNEALRRLQEQVLKNPHLYKAGLMDANGNQQPDEDLDHLMESDTLGVDSNENQPKKVHPLFDQIERGQFLIMKAPNHEFLVKSVREESWCMTKKSHDTLVKLLIEVNVDHVILFITIKDSNIFQAVCKVQKNAEIRDVTDDWLKLHPVQFHSVVKVQFLSFPDLPFVKTCVSSLKNQGGEQINQLMLSNQQNWPLIRDGCQLAWDSGSSLAKLCIDYEKSVSQAKSGSTSTQQMSVYKTEYIKAKKEHKNILKKEQNLRSQDNNQDQNQIQEIEDISPIKKAKEDIDPALYVYSELPEFQSLLKNKNADKKDSDKKQSEKKEEQKQSTTQPVATQPAMPAYPAMHGGMMPGYPMMPAMIRPGFPYQQMMYFRPQMGMQMGAPSMYVNPNQMVGQGFMNPPAPVAPQSHHQASGQSKSGGSERDRKESSRRDDKSVSRSSRDRDRERDDKKSKKSKKSRSREKERDRRDKKESSHHKDDKNKKRSRSRDKHKHR